MPGFSDGGISQISSVTRFTCMLVFSFISEMVYLVCLVCLVYLVCDASDVEHHAYLPAGACLLELVQMFRDPFHIGVEFLCLLIHLCAD
jgi:hypothetical protein